LAVLFATVGMLARHAVLIEHEHAGGTDPHDHTSLTGYVRHCHAHDHDDHEDHDDHADHDDHDDCDDRNASDPHDATSEGPSNDGGAPHDRDDDGDRHGHYVSVRAEAVRRLTIHDEDGALRVVSQLVDACAAIAFEPPAVEPPPSPEAASGHPPSRSGRAAARLVQGIGLRI